MPGSRRFGTVRSCGTPTTGATSRRPLHATPTSSARALMPRSTGRSAEYSIRPAWCAEWEPGSVETRWDPPRTSTAWARCPTRRGSRTASVCSPCHPRQPRAGHSPGPDPTQQARGPSSAQRRRVCHRVSPSRTAGATRTSSSSTPRATSGPRRRPASYRAASSTRPDTTSPRTSSRPSSADNLCWPTAWSSRTPWGTSAP